MADKIHCDSEETREALQELIQAVFHILISQEKPQPAFRRRLLRLDNAFNKLFETGDIVAGEEKTWKRQVLGHKPAPKSISIEDVRAIRADQRPGKDIAKHYHIAPSTVSQIKTGARHRNVE